VIHVLWVVLVAPLFEGLAFFALALGAPGTAAALHVAAAGVVAEGFWRRSQHEGGERGEGGALQTGWFWVALFPLFGVLEAVLLLAQRGAAGRAAHGESWQERRSRDARNALLEKQRAQQIAPDVVPLIDALHDRDANLRISAIEALRDAHGKRVVKVLAKETDNTLYDVRFRAVESLGRISAQYLEKIAEVEGEVKKEAALLQNSLGTAVEAHRRLALLCFEYADFGLDATLVNQRYFERAVGLAERALRSQRRPDPDLRVLLAKALWRLGDLERAEAEYRRAIASDAGHVDALLGLAELQFVRKDFHGLRRTCASLRGKSGVKDSALREAINYWSEGETDPERTWPSRPR
jgi:tetratricopeptide (TPR) repeat protein